MANETSELYISVVIPTKNEADVIDECLSSIFAQSLKPIEVIVVDGKSSDDTIEHVRQFAVDVITENEPTSLPNARNLGAKKAKGDIVLIMDADIILDKNCLQNALLHFYDPSVVAVVPSEHNIPHTKLEKIQMDWTRGGLNSMRPGVGISVFAEFIRKSVFKTLFFDSALGYGEDEHFQSRLKSAYALPGQIVHASDCIISVHHCHTLKELKSQCSWYGRTFKTFASKDFSLKVLLNFGSLVAPLALIIFGLLSIFFWVAIPFFLFLSAAIITRNAIICYNTKSLAFFQFVGFEFFRSFFFVRGLFQGLFSKQRGR